MKTPTLIFSLAVITAASTAYAVEDDMMGTMINGRTEIRSERSARVQDPEMDRELMEIDRQRRQHRTAGTAREDEMGADEAREPYRGPLPRN